MTTKTPSDNSSPVCSSGAGHHVIACENAATALAVAEPFDLLVVDLILPGGQRPATDREAPSQRARSARDPDVRLSLERELMPGPPSVFLQKPMMPSAVVEAVDKLLAETQQ